MKVDHIGYAVRNIERAQKALLTMGGYHAGPAVEDRDRGVRIAFCDLDGVRLELVSPMRPGTPVDTYLQKQGNTPYHVCYQSEDLEADVTRLRRSGFKVTVPPAPAVAFGGRRVAFLYSLSLGLVELVESGGLPDM